MSRINISNIETNDDIITFTAGDINISLANAVRRTIISNILLLYLKQCHMKTVK